MSCDNKAKLPVGIPCVNRLSTLSRKFFMTGQGPDHPDHDHRTGRLITPEGYQILIDKVCDNGVESDDESIHEENEEESDENNNSTNVSVDDQDNQQSGDNDPNATTSGPSSGLILVERLDAAAQNLNSPSQPLIDDTCCEDSILQVDGGEDSDSDDEFGVNDFLRTRKRPRLIEPIDELDEDSNDDTEAERAETDVNCNYSSDEDDETDNAESITVEIQPDTDKLTKDQLNRDHVPYPSTGPCYVFYKSNRTMPSNIARHVNDLLTICI